MTVAPLPGRVPTSSGRAGTPGRLSRWAVGLSVSFGAAFVASAATVATTYALGGESAIEDTWLGALLAGAAFAGLFGSLAAFVLAVVARARRQRSALLWLPFLVFPALVVFLVLGEALWWE